jgi:hypothetical protein
LEVFRVFGLLLSRIIQHSTWILVVSADTGADQSEHGERGQIPWIEHLRNNDDILCQILFFEQYNVKKSSLITDVIHFSCARVRIARMRGYWYNKASNSKCQVSGVCEWIVGENFYLQL